LQEHLQTLTEEDWNKLFVLIPELESTTKFGEIKGGKRLADGSISDIYVLPSKIVDEVYFVLCDLDLIPIFDWVNWHEGKSILDNPDFDYSTLDTVTLCKLLTVIVRTDRFCEGFFVSNFENGVMQKIIHAFKHNELKRRQTHRF
jgi:hypothetical protein